MSKKRAANLQGNVRQRPNGLWECRFYVSEPDGVHRRRVSVYAPSQKEALQKAHEYLVQHSRGLVARPDRRRFGDFAKEVLERHTRGKAANTRRNYARELALALEHIGDIPLQKLTPHDLRRMLDRVGEAHSPRTVAKVLERVRLVLREALALELIHRDPSAAVRLPRASERDKAAQHLEPPQVRLLLEYADASKSPVMALLLRVLVQLGLRKGEALGLQWRDVDFVGATLKVERQYTLQGSKPDLGPLKTRAARRFIPIPADLLARLENYRRSLTEKVGSAKALERIAIFPCDINAPNHYLRRLIGRIQEEHPDFPQVRIHDLRHTAASLLLARGVDVSLVSERLGHGNASVTLSVYRHLLSEERQQGVLPLEDLLGGPRHRA
ncbi:MAG: site-specific integrase [Meiothermus silvanus]|nr:site-specific integrase [Allomeiothermus silvanus]